MSEWIVRDWSATVAVQKIGESEDDSIDLIGMLDLIAESGKAEDDDVEIARRLITKLNNAE